MDLPWMPAPLHVFLSLNPLSLSSRRSFLQHQFVFFSRFLSSWFLLYSTTSFTPPPPLSHAPTPATTHRAAARPGTASLIQLLVPLRVIHDLTPALLDDFAIIVCAPGSATPGVAAPWGLFPSCFLLTVFLNVDGQWSSEHSLTFRRSYLGCEYSGIHKCCFLRPRLCWRNFLKICCTNRIVSPLLQWCIHSLTYTYERVPDDEKCKASSQGIMLTRNAADKHEFCSLERPAWQPTLVPWQRAERGKGVTGREARDRAWEREDRCLKRDYLFSSRTQPFFRTGMNRRGPGGGGAVCATCEATAAEEAHEGRLSAKALRLIVKEVQRVH